MGVYIYIGAAVEEGARLCFTSLGFGKGETHKT